MLWVHVYSFFVVDARVYTEFIDKSDVQGRLPRENQAFNQGKKNRIPFTFPLLRPPFVSGVGGYFGGKNTLHSK